MLIRASASEQEEQGKVKELGELIIYHANPGRGFNMSQQRCMQHQEDPEGRPGEPGKGKRAMYN